MALESEIGLRSAEVDADTSDAGAVAAATPSVSAALSTLTQLAPGLSGAGAQLQALAATVHDPSTAQAASTQGSTLGQALQQALQAQAMKDAESAWLGS